MIGQARQSTVVIPSGARDRDVADRALSWYQVIPTLALHGAV